MSDPLWPEQPSWASAPLVVDLLARCCFPPPGRAVVCGVSGGADSSALLALAMAAGCVATAVHVDHGLRPGSDREADRVAQTAERLGAAFRSVRVTVADGPNLEARARQARHEVLGDEALLGHTAEDQAETVLLALLRGTGLHGLAGMRPGPRRPLLGLRRAETEALCAQLGLDVVDDPSNADPRFRRNRVRNELLPLLADIAERDPVPLLVRTATRARMATDELDRQAALIDPTDVAALRAAPPELARLALRAWIRRSHPEHHPPDAASLERAMAVVAGTARAAELRGGWRVERRAGVLQLVRAGVADR